MNKCKLLLFSLLIIIIVPIVSAENETYQIEQDFIKIDSLILDLSNDGFQVQRVNDTYQAAIQVFEAQQQIKYESRRDYKLVFQYIDDIEELYKQAYIAKDEIDYVNSLYQEVKNSNPEIDLSEADKIIEEMNFEFNNEVYDKAYSLARESYAKIIQIEGQQTALNLAYLATTRSIKNFFIENWITIIIVTFSFIVFYIVFHNRIMYYRTKAKIRKLETESKVLESLIMNSQRAYFEEGTISESTYRIRIKKFSELVRDINRQIPLLKEELAKRKKGDVSYEESDKKEKVAFGWQPKGKINNIEKKKPKIEKKKNIKKTKPSKKKKIAKKTKKKSKK